MKEIKIKVYENNSYLSVKYKSLICQIQPYFKGENFLTAMEVQLYWKWEENLKKKKHFTATFFSQSARGVGAGMPTEKVPSLTESPSCVVSERFL